MTGDAAVRTGVWFQGGLTVSAASELAARAEETGVDAAWVAEGPVARDAFITLSAIAMRTSRVELGTGVVNPYTRHPAQLASSFATLDELSDGRAVCGIGIGARDFLIPLGADVSKPLTAAREMVEIMRRLLARELVEFQGTKFTLDQVRLGFRPRRERMPIYLAATGPKMCGLAGAAADGIYLMYGTRGYVKNALALAHEGRSDADDSLLVASPILMAVDDEIDQARAQVKPGIGLMLTEPNGEGLLSANGLDPALAQRIRDGLATGGVRALQTAVDNSVVDAMTIIGSRQQCISRLQEAVSWGITQPQVLLTGSDPEPVLGVLSELRRSIQ